MIAMILKIFEPVVGWVDCIFKLQTRFKKKEEKMRK